MHNIANPREKIATDIVAFRAMATQGARQPYPVLDMRWGLAATAGAFTTFHIDSDGLATYISCVNQGGSKWWVIVSPKSTDYTSAFANVRKSFEFQNEEMCHISALGDVQVEAVLLMPGTQL